MIKLQAKSIAPVASSTVVLESEGIPSIVLAVKDAYQVSDRNEFVKAAGRRTQLVSCARRDGTAIQLRGNVPEGSAIDTQGGAVHRVELEVELQPQLKAAREAGQRSGSYTQLTVLRVARVWFTRESGKPDYEAPELPGLNGSQGKGA